MNDTEAAPTDLVGLLRFKLTDPDNAMAMVAFLELQRRGLERRMAAVEALFAGGPDTSCRTVWDGDLECVSVPVADLRAALGQPS